MATSQSSIESLSTVMIDMGTESIRDSASHSTTIAQLRASLLSRNKIPNNIVFFDSNGHTFTDEAEQSTNMKQLANENNIVTLKTNKSNQSLVQIPEPKHKRNDGNSEFTYIQTLNQATRTPLPEIKITDSPSESSSNSNSIKLASKLDLATWREIIENSNLCYGIRMDKNTPECALYPAFEFQHSTNSTFRPKVEDSFDRKDYIKDKEMQISFVSSDFFDGELGITCPYVGIGVNGGYFKSKARTSTERLVYKIRCDKYSRAILTLDPSYMKPTTSFIRKIDEILSLFTINQQIIGLKNFYKHYGHVYATKVVLGGNCYRKETHIVKDIAEENKLRVNAGISFKLPVFQSPSVHVGGEHQHNSQTKTSEQTSDLLWETVGGDTVKFNSQNMTPWKETLYDPLLWRVIEQDDYQPIITMLDEQRKRKIEEIENYYKKTNQETDSSEEEDDDEEIDIKERTKWRQRGITVAGGYSKGNELNQLDEPLGICIDGEFIYIADAGNHRIIRFTPTVDDGQIVAGGNGRGNKINQLNRPTNVIVDKVDNSLIIFDSLNERVIRWSLENNRTYGEVIISKIKCSGITMDKDGSIYVFDLCDYVVRRWKKGENNGTIITDVCKHSRFFNSFEYGNIFVDNDHSLYVMKYRWKRRRYANETINDCVSYVDKWTTNDGKWIPVIDNESYEKFNNESIMAKALLVDEMGGIYVADSDNGRVIRWSEDGSIGRVIVGEGVNGGQANQLDYPSGIAFDHKGNLYVADRWNHRIQKFEIDRN